MSNENTAKEVTPFLTFTNGLPVDADFRPKPVIDTVVEPEPPVVLLVDTSLTDTSISTDKPKSEKPKAAAKD